MMTNHRLVVRRHHIGEDGRIRLKCTASVLDLYWRTAEEVAQVTKTQMQFPYWSGDNLSFFWSGDEFGQKLLVSPFLLLSTRTPPSPHPPSPPAPPNPLKNCFLQLQPHSPSLPRPPPAYQSLYQNCLSDILFGINLSPTVNIPHGIYPDIPWSYINGALVDHKILTPRICDSSCSVTQKNTLSNS